MKKIKESNGFPTSGSPRRPESDFYPTPVWATEALLKCEQFVGDIWEPACGLGAMSKVLEQAGYCVKSTDLYEYGYGEAGWDFISALSCYKQVPNIVTNPPYNQAEDFITQGIKLAKMFQCTHPRGARQDYCIRTLLKVKVSRHKKSFSRL